MSNRPVGAWGRPTCPQCGQSPVDTDHALSCSAHSAAFMWFWSVAQSLVPTETIDRSTSVLLGGCAPCVGLAGFRGPAYCWEVLRVSFLSVLYRMWVRAGICVQQGDDQHIFYESRHIILSAVACIRLIIRLDARRASAGVRHVQRDGAIVKSDRFRSFFVSSWVDTGWAYAHSGRYFPCVGVVFPVMVDLENLRPLHFPSRGSRTTTPDFAI